MSFVEGGTWGRMGGTTTDSSTSMDTSMVPWDAKEEEGDCGKLAL